MNRFLYRIQTYRYPIILFSLVSIIVFFQTKGLLVLHRDGTHFFIKLLEKGSPVSYDSARRFAMLIGQSPTSLALFLGITNLKVLAYLFSFSYAAVPTLPLIYNYFFKGSNSIPLILSWLFFLYNSLFSAFYLISESIIATVVMLIMLSYLLKPSSERKKIENVLFLVCCFLSSKLYPSVLFYIPLFIYLLFREGKTQEKTGYVTIAAISLLIFSFIHATYWLIYYPYQTIEGSSILNVSDLFLNYYYLVSHFIFLVSVLSILIDTNSKSDYTILLYAAIIIISIVWFMAIQDSTTFPWQHYRYRMINSCLPLLLYLAFRTKNKVFYRPILIWILSITMFAQINYSNQHLLVLDYLKEKCSRERNLVYANFPEKIKGVERDAFHLPSLSLLACAMNGKTVNALVLSKDKNAYQLFDPLKLDTYPHLERFGADINVSPYINE